MSTALSDLTQLNKLLTTPGWTAEFGGRLPSIPKIPGIGEVPLEYVLTALRMEGTRAKWITPHVWASNLPEGAQLIRWNISEATTQELQSVLEQALHKAQETTPGYLLDILQRERVVIVPASDLGIKISEAEGTYENGVLKEILAFRTRNLTDAYALISFGPKE